MYVYVCIYIYIYIYIHPFFSVHEEVASSMHLKRNSQKATYNFNFLCSMDRFDLAQSCRATTTRQFTFNR